MRITKIHVLLACVIFEAAVIQYLVGRGIRIEVNKRPVMASELTTPLEIALQYDSSDAKFKELVREHPDYVNYFHRGKGAIGLPILTQCALANKTNYVEILMEAGADEKQATNALVGMDAEDAIKLIVEVQARLGKRAQGE